MCISRPEAMPIWIKKKRSKNYVHWVHSMEGIAMARQGIAICNAHKIKMTGYRLVYSPHTLCTRSKMIKIASFQNMKQYRWNGNMIFHLFVCLFSLSPFLFLNNNKWNDFGLNFYLVHSRRLLAVVFCLWHTLLVALWLRVLRKLVCSCNSYLIWCIRLSVNRNNSLFSILS